MGGFVSQIGNHPIAALEQLEDPLLGPEYISAIRAVKETDILDRSKGDALAKGVALVQGLWFATQCLARVSLRLPITILEVGTAAFAVLSIVLWLLWWGKPLDVQQPIPVGPELQAAEYINPPLPLGTRVGGLIFGFYRDHTLTSATSVPTFWSGGIDSDMHAFASSSFVAEGLAGAVFGAIHCTAWHAEFASTIERWLWRSCSALVATIPPVLGFIFALRLAIHGAPPVKTVSNIGFSVGIPIYILCRLVLIILVFTTLRKLPSGVYIEVDWSVYIPHF
jgi:hypothetical protein